jgi:hypothetical protein
MEVSLPRLEEVAETGISTYTSNLFSFQHDGGGGGGDFGIPLFNDFFRWRWQLVYA